MIPALTPHIGAGWLSERLAADDRYRGDKFSQF